MQGKKCRIWSKKNHAFLMVLGHPDNHPIFTPIIIDLAGIFVLRVDADQIW
jgi:hypothetical protein